MTIQDYGKIYEQDLDKSVIPFWLKHGPDKHYGGYFTGLERDGTVYDDRKYIWLQGRALWMFSRLYNEWAPRPEYREAARLGAEFLSHHGQDPEGRWYFCLTRDGTRPVSYQRKPYGAVFVMMGFLEYGKMVNDISFIRKAEELFWRIVGWIDSPEQLGRLARPEGASETSALADEMVLMSMAMELLRVKEDPKVRAVLTKAYARAFLHFDPSRKILMELTALDGTSLHAHPEGRLFNPGHSVEVAWFLLQAMDIIKPAPGDKDKALTIIESSLERGWDKIYGGLFYLMDIEGRPPLQLEHDMKLWWPLTEAIYALVLAYCSTREERWLTWLAKVHDYTYARCPDPEHGEWFGYFDCQGNRTHTCKGGNYKGFFHIPRALLFSVQSIRCMAEAQPK